MEKQPINAPQIMRRACGLWATRKAQAQAAAKAAAASTEPQPDSTPS